MDSHEATLCVILGLLIFLSACFSSTETAFTSVNGIRLKNMAKEGNAKAKIAYQVYKEDTSAITTILIGNNIVNILATAIATDLFMAVFGPAGVAVATGVMTLLILVFGEITPKVLAKSSPEKFCLVMAKPMKVLLFIFRPFTKIVVGLQDKWEEGSDIEKVTATEDELLEIVNTIEQEGELEQEERELIENVIEFDDTSVHDVMVPRDDVLWIYDNADAQTLKNLFLENRLSRFPVISHETLKVVGIVILRDVFDSIVNEKELNIRKLMSEPIFISQWRKLPQAMEELQKSRVHMAIVTESNKADNFVGVVTLEDMIEEIVGEIYDESDTLPDHVFEIGLHTFEVDCEISLAHFFNKYLEDEVYPDTQVKTIAEWINEINDGKKVRKGREIKYENYEIKVLATKEGFATKAEITVYTAPEEEE